MSGVAGGHVVILLSTFNGAAFLHDQLDSFVAQTYPYWTLLWRDDGSTDLTTAVMAAFTTRVGSERCRHLADDGEHLGPCQSYLALLRAAVPTLAATDAVAFSDQDDVWLPEKLAHGMRALSDVPAGTPALVCSRQCLVDARLAPGRLSPPFRRPPGFPAALTQNIATGCTILLNRAAAQLIAQSMAPTTTMHDWWSYLLVAAAGGRVLALDEPLVLYRQHAANAIGAPATTWRRAASAWRRGPLAFMRLFRDHLAALAAHRHLISHDAAADVARLQTALSGGVMARLRVLRMSGLCRQSALETLMFRLWFLLG